MQIFRDETDMALEWWRGNQPGPLYIELYPTNKCNLQCKHCWQRGDDYDKTYKSEMSDERLLKLVEEAQALGVKGWTIKGGGEPMARGKLVMKLCEEIMARGMGGVIHTNGALFKPEQLEKLVEIGWWKLHFSIDAPEAEINDYIRTGGFTKAAAAMAHIRDLRVERQTEFPKMLINMVVTRTNYHKLVDMVDFAADHGVEKINVSGMLWFSEMCDEFMPDEKMKQELPGYVEAGIRRAAERGIEVTYADLLDEQLTGNPNDMYYGEPYSAKRGVDESLCFKPFSMLTIHPDGLTGPCCMSYDTKSNNIKDSTLEEVWYGPYMEMVRRNFLQNRPMTYCSQCPTSMYREIGETRARVKSFIGNRDQVKNWKLPATLAAKTVASLRERGLSQTITRAKEWIEIYR